MLLYIEINVGFFMDENTTITKKEFSEALHGLGACGKLYNLVTAFSEATSPDTRKRIERAIVVAMKVSQRDDWREFGHRPGFNWDVEWTGRYQMKRVLGIKCSDATKKTAERILMNTPWIIDKSRRLRLSKAMQKEKEKHAPRVNEYSSRVDSYIRNERRKAKKDVLSRGTVRPPRAKAMARSCNGAGKGINILKA
jgi:hypothetical protein